LDQYLFGCLLGYAYGSSQAAYRIRSEDREKLDLMARRRKTSQAMGMRAGLSNAEVAHRLHISGRRLANGGQFGLDGLLDEPRVGAPRKITDRLVEEVVTKTLESMPAQSTRWSTRLMAAETGLSQKAIVRILARFRIAAASRGGV
jgi:hypothetical protein